MTSKKEDPTRFYHPFSKKLDQLIDSSGYSLAKIEELTGIASSYLSKWRSGNLKAGKTLLSPPNDEHMEKLNDLFYPDLVRYAAERKEFIDLAKQWKMSYRATFFPVLYSKQISLAKNRKVFEDALNEAPEARVYVSRNLRKIILSDNFEHQGELLEAIIKFCGVGRPELFEALKWGAFGGSNVFRNRKNIGREGRAKDFAEYLHLDEFGVEDIFYDTLAKLQNKYKQDIESNDYDADQIFEEALKGFNSTNIIEGSIAGKFVNRLCNSLVKYGVIKSTANFSSSIGNGRHSYTFIEQLKRAKPTDQVLCEISDTLPLGYHNRERLRTLGFRERGDNKTIEEIMTKKGTCEAPILLERIRVAKGDTITHMMSGICMKRNYIVDDKAVDLALRNMWKKWINGSAVIDPKALIIIASNAFSNEVVDSSGRDMKLFYLELLFHYFGYEFEGRMLERSPSVMLDFIPRKSATYINLVREKEVTRSLSGHLFASL